MDDLDRRVVKQLMYRDHDRCTEQEFYNMHCNTSEFKVIKITLILSTALKNVLNPILKVVQTNN